MARHLAPEWMNGLGMELMLEFCLDLYADHDTEVVFDGARLRLAKSRRADTPFVHIC